MSARDAETRQALLIDGPDLLAYLQRRASSAEDAADLLAETFLQVWRRVDDLPTDADHRRRWLFRIAGNVLANGRRSGRRRSALMRRLAAQLGATDSVPDPAVGVEVRDAVSRLPDAQGELVRLVHWEGFTIGEAAAVLGVNASTARSRYASARAALRSDLMAPVAPGDVDGRG